MAVGKKVMIVDDDREITLFLQKYFEEKKLNVVSVTNPLDAEKKIIEEQPDLIFMDYRMAPVTGKDILEKLKALKLQIPVVMMSAYKSIDGYYEVRRLGAIEYISKPYNFDEIDRILEQYLFSSP